MNTYEVQVETYEAKYVNKIFGLDEAVAACIEAGTCDNVKTALVMDCETGEVMFHIDDGVVIWVSGIGNPLELADDAAVTMTGKTLAERVHEAIYGDG